MKKVLFGISLLAFLFFGVANIQYVVASDYSIEFAKLDKDPAKDGKKSCTTDGKDVSSTGKKSGCDSKAKADCAPSSAKSGCCASKSASTSTSAKTEGDKK
jgi:hypothetical protein